MKRSSLINIGRVLGVALGLAVQALFVAPALGPSPLTIVGFIVLFVGGLIAGDRIAKELVERRHVAA